MQYCSILLVLLLTSSSCELPPRQINNPVSQNQTTPIDLEINKEEYVMVSTAITMPMYMNRDQRSFKRWGEKMGVKVSILGPADWDVPAQINTIEEVIGTKPSGLLINGTDPAIAQVINKAVAAGIPTVVYDSNIPNGKHHAFLGTDWYDIGIMQGEEMAR
ncbi:MAG: substrate-binding domain-containing protein, partial [Chitinophagaceae bacterium]